MKKSKTVGIAIAASVLAVVVAADRRLGFLTAAQPLATSALSLALPKGFVEAHRLLLFVFPPNSTYVAHVPLLALRLVASNGEWQSS